jgi:GTPase Era involved in 16S rRNA processing
MMPIPAFAVVGRPNKGKSSIVSTLARDPAVHIDARAGTTKNAQRFPMKIDGETLYELVDTPGIQRARTVVEWLHSQQVDASARPAAVARFVREHQGDARFRDECQMLQPIIDGAGIIYVVDGSCPYGAEYEAEMEILRWTGQPSLAVINPIGSSEYIEEWKVGLAQFFRTVRVFDAHQAEPAKQLELLELFGHLDPGWKAALSRAVTVLRRDRLLAHETSAYLITDLLIDSLTYQVEQNIPEGVPAEQVRNLLSLRFKSHLEQREKQTRRQLEELYNHGNLDRTQHESEPEESDLFNVEDWYLWGLNKWQLVSLSAAAGLAAGLAFDVLHGGMLGPVGTTVSVLGGAASGAAGWFYADKIAKLKIMGIPAGGKRCIYGPVKNVNFPFVLLGRSLWYQQMVSTRAHANRSSITVDKSALEHFPQAELLALGKLFVSIQAGKQPADNRQVLAGMLIRWCSAADDPAPVAR